MNNMELESPLMEASPASNPPSPRFWQKTTFWIGCTAVLFCFLLALVIYENTAHDSFVSNSNIHRGALGLDYEPVDKMLTIQDTDGQVKLKVPYFSSSVPLLYGGYLVTFHSSTGDGYMVDQDLVETPFRCPAYRTGQSLKCDTDLIPLGVKGGAHLQGNDGWWDLVKCIGLDALTDIPACKDVFHLPPKVTQECITALIHSGSKCCSENAKCCKFLNSCKK